MKNDIFASVYHSASTDQNPTHAFCPKGSSSWCFYQKALSMKKTPGDHSSNVKTPINAVCFEKILPLYQRLSDDSLLERCRRCLTQNANESLHSIIWNRCSKKNYCGKERVKFADLMGVCEYNVGSHKTLTEVMSQLNIKSTTNLAQLKITDEKKLNRSTKKKIDSLQNAQ